MARHAILPRPQRAAAWVNTAAPRHWQRQGRHPCPQRRPRRPQQRGQLVGSDARAAVQGEGPEAAHVRAAPHLQAQPTWARRLPGPACCRCCRARAGAARPRGAPAGRPWRAAMRPGPRSRQTKTMLRARPAATPFPDQPSAPLRPTHPSTLPPPKKNITSLPRPKGQTMQRAPAPPV
jgi:hypothetical protein